VDTQVPKCVITKVDKLIALSLIFVWRAKGKNVEGVTGSFKSALCI
jgi:hypothetical protein